MPSLVVIGQQIKEKRRGGGAHCTPAYMITKYHSLNRVKRQKKLGLIGLRILSLWKSEKLQLCITDKKHSNA